MHLNQKNTFECSLRRNTWTRYEASKQNTHYIYTHRYHFCFAYSKTKKHIFPNSKGKRFLYAEKVQIMKFEKARPFMAIVFIQFLYALMSIVAKIALNQGMSPHVLVAYRMAVAAALITPFALVLERYLLLLLVVQVCKTK